MPPSTKSNIQANDRLSSSNQPTYTHRERVTIADINAGYTLLPAVPGYKYRMTYLAMISIGGNAGATTTVDILGTQAGAVVKLLAAAIAALTRSTLSTPPAANNTILADGASYAENDVNTAITVGKTGAALTTATHVDFIVDYELIPARTGA